jgi:hypothetical protein
MLVGMFSHRNCEVMRDIWPSRFSLTPGQYLARHNPSLPNLQAICKGIIHTQQQT